jgi:hypothetical protein
MVTNLTAARYDATPSQPAQPDHSLSSTQEGDVTTSDGLEPKTASGLHVLEATSSLTRDLSREDTTNHKSLKLAVIMFAVSLAVLCMAMDNTIVGTRSMASSRP